MKLCVICLDKGDWLENLSNQTFQDFQSYSLFSNNIDLCTLANEKVQGIKSDYVVFVHEQIVSLADRFQKQVEYLDENKNVTAVGSSVKLIRNGSCSRELIFPEKSFRCYSDFYLYKKDFFFDYAVMMRRDAFLAAGGLNRSVRNSEEQLNAALFLSLWTRFLHNKGKLANIQTSLVQCDFDLILEHEDYLKEKNLIWGMFRRKTFQIQPLKPLSTKLFEML